MILTSENDNTWRQTSPTAILSTTNPTWTGLGIKECLMKALDNPGQQGIRGLCSSGMGCYKECRQAAG
jgi:hypothetical protein